jgi:hypothetical protein
MLCELLQGLDGERAVGQVEALLRNIASPWRYDGADCAQFPAVPLRAGAFLA